MEIQSTNLDWIQSILFHVSPKLTQRQQQQQQLQLPIE